MSFYFFDMIKLEPNVCAVLQDSDEEGSEDDGDGDFRHTVASAGRPGARTNSNNNNNEQSSLTHGNRSGVLPGVNRPIIAAVAKGSNNFDAMLNSFEDSDEDGQKEKQKPQSKGASRSSITDRMRAIDSQLEDMERNDSEGELAAVRRQQEDDSSVASENIDEMEFSTGGGHDDASESSGEGSFSFLDSSKK